MLKRLFEDLVWKIEEFVLHAAMVIGFVTGEEWLDEDGKIAAFVIEDVHILPIQIDFKQTVVRGMVEAFKIEQGL